MNTQKKRFTNQQKREASISPRAFGVSDVYFILFRHKWKILVCSLIGILGAAGLYFLKPAMYRSDAQLLVRYVMDERSIGVNSQDQQIRSPDDRGANIMNSEIGLLRSRDIAVMVAETVGPKKVLMGSGGDTNLFAAVGLVRKNLTISVPPKSSVLAISYEHRDPQVAQEILSALVTSYLEKHIEIHKSVGAYDVLQRQTDQLRSRLTETEKELNEVKRQAGIVSLEDAKKEQAFLLDNLRKLILDTEQDLVTRKAKVDEFEKWLASNVPSNTPPQAVAAPTSVATNDLKVPVQQRLSVLHAKRLELLGQFKKDSEFVLQVEREIAELEALKRQWEVAEPSLPLSLTNAASTFVLTSAHLEHLANEKNEIVALEAKMKVLNTQLDKVKTDAAALDKVANRIQELTRQRDLEETNFKYFYQRLEQARIDNSIEAGKFSNISQIQTPSFGIRDTAEAMKLIFGVLFGGPLLGLGLALVTEFFFDQTIRRPIDIETRTKAPVFLTIPQLNGASQKVNKLGDAERAQLPEKTGAKMEVAHWEPGHPLHPYYESLRDRLITYFEVRGMYHKPKLVAVTGCSEGSGVTSIAAGLAASLSETGDGNVLLVDFNSGQGAAHPFYRGKPCALPEHLDSGNRDSAMVQEHLYWVAGAEPSELLPRVLPKRLLQMVPKLKTSDYDYIIFDMPSINQTSAVPRLAGMMDMTFFVVESEKTQREAMERALQMLDDSKANVSTILNKYKKHVPNSLHQEV